MFLRNVRELPELHSVTSQKIALRDNLKSNSILQTLYIHVCVTAVQSLYLRLSCMCSKWIHRRRARILGTSTLAFRSSSRAACVCACACACVRERDWGPVWSEVKKLPGRAGHLSDGEAAVPRASACRGQKSKRANPDSSQNSLCLGIAKARPVFTCGSVSAHSETSAPFYVTTLHHIPNYIHIHYSRNTKFH
jgi:hypothetical protein